MIHRLAEARIKQSPYVDAETVVLEAIVMVRQLRSQGDLQTAFGGCHF